MKACDLVIWHLTPFNFLVISLVHFDNFDKETNVSITHCEEKKSFLTIKLTPSQSLLIWLTM